MIQGSGDEEEACSHPTTWPTYCSGSWGVCCMRGRRLRCEFIREKSRSWAYSQDSEGSRSSWGFLRSMPASCLYCFILSALFCGLCISPDRACTGGSHRKVVSGGLLIAGSNGSQVTHTHRIWVPDLTSTHPIEGSTCESDIPQSLVTLLALILINHQLYFKHLLLFPQVFKMEFLNT